MDNQTRELLRLQKENEALRYRLAITDKFMTIQVMLNTELEHQLKAANSRFERSIMLLKGFIETKDLPQFITVFSRVYHLINRN